MSWFDVDKEVQEALLLWSAKTNREKVITMMYEAITDIFPGIEKCIKKDLSVMETCTKKCKLFLLQIDKSKFCPNLDFDKELAPHIYSMIEKKIKDGQGQLKKPSPSQFALKKSIEKFLGKS